MKGQIVQVEKKIHDRFSSNYVMQNVGPIYNRRVGLYRNIRNKLLFEVTSNGYQTLFQLGIVENARMKFHNMCIRKRTIRKTRNFN